MLPVRFSPIASALLGILLLAPATVAATVEKEVSVPIQVVSAADIQNGPTCVRVLLDSVDIPPAPRLNVGKSSLTLRPRTDAANPLEDVRIRTADGREHRAIDPICVEGVEVLKEPATAIYGEDAVAGVVDFVTGRPRPGRTGWQPPVSPDQPYTFFAEPVLNPSQVQVIFGPFDGRGPGTSVEVGGQPAILLAETPEALFWLLPGDTPSGSVSLTLTDAGRGARFPVYVLGLAMSAQQLHLMKGQSTTMQATVFGPELMPPNAWEAGVVSWTIDLALVAKLFPGFRIPLPGEPGVVFFRVDNVSTDTVTMKPSKNESHIVSLGQKDFASGPYTYGARLQSKKAGSFTINGLVIAFFAPIPGEPWTPTLTGSHGEGDGGEGR